MKKEKILAVGFGNAIAVFGEKYAGSINRSLLVNSFFGIIVNSVNDLLVESCTDLKDDEAKFIESLLEEVKALLEDYKGESFSEVVSMLSRFFL